MFSYAKTAPRQTWKFSGLEARGAFTFITIDVPGATSTEASGINARGQIVGNYTDAAGTLHGFAAVP